MFAEIASASATEAAPAEASSRITATMTPFTTLLYKHLSPHRAFLHAMVKRFYNFLTGVNAKGP